MDIYLKMKELFIDKIKITHILPCLADAEKIRFIAYFDRNISDILPYLNTVLDSAIYNHNGHTLTIKKEGRFITIHPDRIAAGKIINEKDAWEILEWIKEKINYCHENKEAIKPNFERRQKLTALDIYKLLPGTNCKNCGELTCLAFAVKLTEEKLSIMKCGEIFSAKFSEKKKELLPLLKASGINVPNAFA
jgi:ArsR family metal-binding transcriptional regulator